MINRVYKRVLHVVQYIVDMMAEQLIATHYLINKLITVLKYLRTYLGQFKMNLIYDKTFHGYAVIHQHGPLLEHILLGNEQVLIKAMRSHKRLTVMRFELKFPVGYLGEVDVASKFFDSFRLKIKNDLKNKTESKGFKVHSEIAYVWVKELSLSGGWHYHVALILNKDIYNTFGLITSANSNMYNRILASWASAIGYSLAGASGLVDLSPNGVYHLNQNSDSFNVEINKVMFRLSYFAKEITKPYGPGNNQRFYGTSKR